MIAQLFIALFGVTAVWLSQDSRIERRKYACIFGLIGQPFWVIAALDAEQYGILALCVLYTFSWLRGFKQHWMTK